MKAAHDSFLDLENLSTKHITPCQIQNNIDGAENCFFYKRLQTERMIILI